MSEKIHIYERSGLTETQIFDSFDPNTYEEVIQDWIEGYLKKQKKYDDIKRLGGRGDKGRDVCAYYTNDRLKWDNYQCKHYNVSIEPAVVKKEISKLCYYTYKKEYPIPKSYYFLSPKGLSTLSNDLIYYKQDELKQDIINNWENYAKELPDDALKFKVEITEYINSKIDFSIFKEISPNKFIEQFKTTNYFSFRFKQDIKLNPDYEVNIPNDIKDAENNYVKQLLDVYSEKANSIIKKDNIPEQYVGHFKRQRKFYYSTEALERITRDACRNEKPFKDIEEDIYNSIIDTVENEKIDTGYEKLNNSLKEARTCHISESNELYKAIDSSSKQGFCHYLANENRVKWVNNDK